MLLRFTSVKFYGNSFWRLSIFVSFGRTDMGRNGEAKYCAVDGAGYFEVIGVVTGVDRWTARVGFVVDSKVCVCADILLGCCFCCWSEETTEYC